MTGTPHPLFETWAFVATHDEVAVVQPDGCRDVICVTRAGGAREVFLTDWDVAPRRVDLRAGTKVEGVRLRPGVTLEHLPETDGGFDRAAIVGAVHHTAELSEIIDALTEPQATVAGVARQGAMSLRSLQRQFRAHGLPPPDFWRLLGRARRAVLGLSAPVPLAEIACDHGYADQAHMTRAFTRWFGVTPAALRRDPARMAGITGRGLGTWALGAAEVR